MPRRIEHRAQYEHSADKVYATLVDAEYLRARLAELGGKGAELTEHSVDGDRAAFRVRHGLDAQNLPSVVRTIISGDLVINRAENWEPTDGGYRAHSTVTIDGTPAKIAATLTLSDTGSGSELRNVGEVEVSIPFVGGKVEETVAQHVHRLLDAEHGFTEKWLARG